MHWWAALEQDFSAYETATGRGPPVAQVAVQERVHRCSLALMARPGLCFAVWVLFLRRGGVAPRGGCLHPPPCTKAHACRPRAVAPQELPV